jgi:hypothetical protein
MPNDNLKKYYDYLKSNGADVAPSYDSFANSLSNENNAKKYHSYLINNGFDAPKDYNNFVSTLGLLKKKEVSQSTQVDQVTSLDGSNKEKKKQSVSSNQQGNYSLPGEYLDYPGKGIRRYYNGKWYDYSFTETKNGKDLSVYDVQITDPVRVNTLNKKFNKVGSTSETEEVFTGFPGQEKNEYRVIEDKWQKKMPGMDKWRIVTNEGSINSLNKQFSKNVSIPSNLEDLKKKQDQEIQSDKKLNSSLTWVNSGLIGSEEENASKILKQKFPGFEFIQQGPLTDELLVIAPNGARTNISLDNWTDEDDRNQSVVLREFIRNNSDQDLAKTAKELSLKESQERTFLEDKKKQSLEAGILSQDWKFENGKLTIETPLDKAKKSEDFKRIQSETKTARGEYMSEKAEQFDDIYYRFKNNPNKNDEMIAAYASVKADNQEISRVNNYVNDVKNVSNDVAKEKLNIENYANDIISKVQSGEISQQEFDDIYRPEIDQKTNDLNEKYKNLSNDLKNISTVDKSINESVGKNYLIKEATGSVIGGVTSKFIKGFTYLPRLASMGEMSSADQEEIVNLITGGGTTKEYMESEKRNDLTKALFSMSESVGILTSSSLLGGGAAAYPSFYAQSYYEMKDELDKIEGMSEKEKVLLSGSYGVVSSLLEKFGIDSAMQKTAVGRNLTNSIMKSAFSDLPKNASKEFIDAAIMNSFKKYVVKSGVQAAIGAGTEGITEALQNLSGVAIKEVYDQAKGTEYFNNKSAWNILGDAVYEGYLGALGGGIMSTVTSSKDIVARGLRATLNKEQIDALINSAKVDGVNEALITNLKSSILTGKMTKDEAKEISESFNLVKSKLESLPEDMSNEDKSVSLDLLIERDKLQKESSRLDEALRAPYNERITEINNELLKISENAVQKQTTGEVPVQPEATVGGEMEEGKPQAEPQGVTEEGKVAAKEEVAKRISELESLIASDNASMEKEGQGNLIPEARQSILNELQTLKAETKPIEETVVVEPITKQEQKQNLVTQENVEELRAQQTTPVAQKIFTTAKLAMKALPGVKIYVHNTTNEFDQAIGQKSAEGAKGAYVDGEIHINLENGADVVTMLHESMHHGLVVKGVESGAMTDLARGLKSVISDKALNQRLDDFILGYDGSEQAEEYLAELGGIMAEAKQELTTTKFQQFKNLINKIAQKLGLPTVFSAAANAKNAVDFMNSLTKSIATGQEIKPTTPYSVGEAVSVKPNAPMKVKYQRKAEYNVDFVTKIPTKSLKDVVDKYNGKVFMIQSDATGVGYDSNGDPIYGGIGYMAIKENVDGKIGFASVDMNTAKTTISKMINRYGSNEKIAVLVMVQNPSSTVGNYYGGKYFGRALIELQKQSKTNYKEIANSFVDFIESKQSVVDALNKNKTHQKLIELIKNPGKFDEVGFAQEFVKDTTFDVRREILKTLLPEKADIRTNKSTPYIKQSLKDLGFNRMAFLNEYGDNTLFTEDMYASDEGGLLAAGFEMTLPTAEGIDQFVSGIENRGIKHHLFNGKLPYTDESFLLDGLYPVNENFSEFAKSQMVFNEENLNKDQLKKIVQEKFPTDKSYDDKYTRVNSKNFVKTQDRTYTHLTSPNKIKFKAELQETNPEYFKEQRPDVSTDIARGMGFTAEKGAKQEALVEKAKTKGFSKVKFQKTAPNGKPSNLNDKQWEQVRTPEFKKWFGDWENDPANASKVVDENGEPLVVYHGTRKSFDEFSYDVKPANFRAGALEYSFWFTANKKNSELYGNQVMEVFLNSKNPIEIDYTNPESYREIVVPADKTRAMSIAEFNEKKGNIKHSQMRQGIELRMSEDKSIDGIIHRNIKDVILSDNFQAFNPNQIKSATENVGTFSAETRNIKFQKANLTTDKDAKPGYESALNALGETEQEREQWRKNNKVNQKQRRNPLVEQAVKDYYNEEITQEEYLDIVSKNQPIKPFKQVPALPSLEEITNALDSNKVATGIIGLTKNLKDGERVASRLDIPAYEDFDTWVVSVHDGNKEGKSIAYGQTAVLKNVDFKTFPGPAIRIAMGTQNKSTIARMFGNWVNEDPESVHARAEELMNDPAWTQVGMNPFRYSWFYDKTDGMPLASADEVIQVGALVLAKNAKKVSPSDPMFETKSAKGGKIKFQKANTQQEAIQKAKEKYTLSVEERGNPHKQGVDAALNDLRKSDWYKTTDDTQRENAERELKAFFGEKLKKAPSVAKILGKPKAKKVIIKDEYKEMIRQIKMEAKAAREAKADLNSKRKMLAAAISGMVKLGKVKASQAAVLVKRVSNLNLDNPVMVERFTNYAQRVFERADYQQRLDDAFAIRKGIRKDLKTDNQAEVSGMAKAFTKIDPSLVEDIDTYMEMAEKVKNAVKPSRVKGLDVVMKEAASIAEISEYTNEEIARQEDIQIKELLATYDFLDNEMSLEEMQKVIDALKDPNSKMNTTEKQKYVKDYLNGRFGIMSSILESMFKTGIDPMTGEEITFDEKQKELIKRALKIDLNEMSVREAIKIVESLENFLTNQITSGLEAAVSSYEGAMNDKQLVQKGFKAKSLKFLRSGYIGRGYTEQLFSLPLMIEKMFGGINKSIEVMNKWGLTNLINGVNKANKQFNTIIDGYMKQKFYDSKGFMDAENVYERGMLATLKRNLVGSPAEMKAEFDRRVRMIQESINTLIENGSSKEQKMGELYQKIYDKLGVAEMDMDVINANASKENLDAVNWWVNQWSKHYSDLSDISLSVYNTQLGSDLNYTPDKYKLLSSEEGKFDKEAIERNSSFALSMEYTDKNKTGVLMETTRPNELPEGRYISLDFDTNNAKSLKAALVDINTASAIRQIDGFMSSKSFNKLIPDSDDRTVIVRRVNTYIRRAKGKNQVPSDTLQDAERFLNFVTTLGVGKALGGVSQAVTQTAPVMLSTVVNTGRFDIAGPEFNAWLDELGVATSNRGLESQSTVESIDRNLEASNGNIKKIIKGTEELSQVYLKWFLSKPDIFVARSAFKSYYLQNLKRRGISTDIDWATHKADMEAVEYAQAMVDRQQNVSDPMLAGEFLASEEPMRKIARKIFLPFASFILNQKARMYNDVGVLFSGASTKEDRIAAGRSLAGLGAELLAFQLIGFAIRKGYDELAGWLFGDDEEEKKKKIFGIEMKASTYNATKYPFKSIINDLISPLPGMTDASVTWSINAALDQYPWMDSKEIKDAVKDRNRILELKGEDPMDAKAEAEYIENMKKEATYQLFDDPDDRKWGMVGIASDTYKEVFDISKLAITGKFIDEYQGRETPKVLLEADREKASYAIAPLILFSTGFAPKDVGTITRNYIKRIKKKGVTEKQYDRYSDVQKDLGRNLKSWEIQLVKDKKESETAISEIEFIERNGGLTERQGREYLKIMKAIGEPTVSDIVKIKEGQTADQILK